MNLREFIFKFRIILILVILIIVLLTFILPLYSKLMVRYWFVAKKMWIIIISLLAFQEENAVYKSPIAFTWIISNIIGGKLFIFNLTDILILTQEYKLYSI